jgi:Flp pilus assembly protein CpaB
MSGRRLLAILVGIAGLLILVFVVTFLIAQPGGDAGTPAADVPGTEGTGGPLATATPTIDPGARIVEVVVSLQTVPRGWQMTEAELTTDKRLAAEVPTNALTSLDQAIGFYARQDIYQGETLTADTLVRDPTLIGTDNFGPSSLVPAGWVAMAIPTDRLSSVAYGLAAGDTADLMLTFTLNALDQEFQTLLSNSASFYLEQEATAEGEVPRPTIFIIDPYGRFEQLPTGDLAHIAPSESTQRPVPIAVILQNARIVNVGLWRPTPAAQPPTPTVDPNAPTPTPGGPPPEPTVQPPTVVLVALPPQQQLFLKYALEVSADIDLALRGVNDAQLYNVQQVDLGALLGQFGIQVPPDFNYTIGGLERTSLEADEVTVEAPVEGQQP